MLLHPCPATLISSSILPGVRPDGDTHSYWASAPDPVSRVDVQLDFGTAKQIKVIEVDWEHPAQVHQIICWHVFGAPRLSAAVSEAFELQVAMYGRKWVTIFATSGNNLQTTKYVGPIVSGTALRIRMAQVLCISGAHQNSGLSWPSAFPATPDAGQ